MKYLKSILIIIFGMAIPMLITHFVNLGDIMTMVMALTSTLIVLRVLFKILDNDEVWADIRAYMN